ncbi:uncharacterized protein LOC144425821 [Styela clava]
MKQSLKVHKKILFIRYRPSGASGKECRGHIIWMQSQQTVFTLAWSVIKSFALSRRQASSANNFVRKLELFDKSFIKSKKPRGPNTLPCGIPYWMGNIGDL